MTSYRRLCMDTWTAMNARKFGGQWKLESILHMLCVRRNCQSEMRCLTMIPNVEATFSEGISKALWYYNHEGEMIRQELWYRYMRQIG